MNYFLLELRQRSEQYFTSSQTFSHFLRQTKGRLQTGQVLWGRFSFNTPFIGLKTISAGLCFRENLG
jgi:hypothetical protein